MSGKVVGFKDTPIRQKVLCWVSLLSMAWVLWTPRGVIKDVNGPVLFPTAQQCQSMANWLNQQIHIQQPGWRNSYTGTASWYMCEWWPE